jgi:hypothetical protein
MTTDQSALATFFLDFTGSDKKRIGNPRVCIHVTPGEWRCNGEDQSQPDCLSKAAKGPILLGIHAAKDGLNLSADVAFTDSHGRVLSMTTPAMVAPIAQEVSCPSFPAKVHRQFYPLISVVPDNTPGSNFLAAGDYTYQLEVHVATSSGMQDFTYSGAVHLENSRAQTGPLTTLPGTLSIAGTGCHAGERCEPTCGPNS